MRFRPANIRLINRRQNLPRLLLALSSKHNDKNNHKDVQGLTGHSISVSLLRTRDMTWERVSGADLGSWRLFLRVFFMGINGTHC
jgi:hypothetical protein